MTASARIGALAAARLLAGLRLRRGLNQVQASFSMWRRRKAADGKDFGKDSGKDSGNDKGTPRTGTAGKAKLGWLLGGLIGLSMLFGAFNISAQALLNMQRVLGVAPAPAAKTYDWKAEQSRPDVSKAYDWKAEQLRPDAAARDRSEVGGLAAGVLQAVALEIVILLLATLFLSLGAGDLAKPDWDLEWLVTLPVSLFTLLAVRIAERTFLTGGLLLLWPFLAMAAWYAGHELSAALGVGLLAAIPLTAIVATLRTLVDTGLRLRVGPAKLRNLQAILGVAAALLLYLGMSAGTSPHSYIMDWAPAVPAWAFWTPPGLATAVVAGMGPGSQSAGTALLALAAQVAVIAAAGLAVLMHQLRAGVVGSGSRESGRRPAAARAPAAASRTAAGARRLLTPVQVRELVLLSRDRNFLVQSLVLPVLVIGSQILINTGSDIWAGAWSSAAGLAAIGFFMAAYALMFSAFQTLNTEGNALWILYSVPHPLESVLRQKAVLWSTVCLAYPVAIFAFALAMGRPPLDVLGLGLVTLAGVPIFAVIATALGVFASDPLAQMVHRRVRPSYTWLYMLLAGLYSYAIFASTVWQRAGLMTLTGLLGLALWQKARDHLPYLLDPAASPPARVSLSDGLIAGMIFFVLQGLVSGILVLRWQQVTGGVVLIAFGVAGATTYLLMNFAFWRLKSVGVPRTFGAGGLRAGAWGAAAGVVAGLAGVIYVQIAQHTALFESTRQSGVVGPDDGLWLLVLVVAAAPIFEEFIFRGLIFGGLRRTLGLGLSVLASAAIFAVVHPPFAVIPVFGLGLATALVYDRTRLLIGPIAAHAVYNAMVVGYQFLP
jgi:ABC-2 type transport system permease protein